MQKDILMAKEALSQITGAGDSQKFLGTNYNPKVQNNTLAARLIASGGLKKVLKDSGMKDLASVLEKIKNLQNMNKDTKQRLEELIQKLKEAAEQFGLRLELNVSQEGDPLVLVYNRLNNRLLTTIPMAILLKQLLGAQTHTGGRNIATPQAVENLQHLKDEISSAPIGTDIIL
jgi:hypothetical protein